MSFIGHNGYPTTCLHLSQYVVHVTSARMHSDKLPGFYMQIAFTLWIHFVPTGERFFKMVLAWKGLKSKSDYFKLPANIMLLRIYHMEATHL